MKKAVNVILIIIGILLILTFFITIIYDYHLIQTKIFAVPLGIQSTIALSGILFLVPGVICLIVAYSLKRKETK